MVVGQLDEPVGIAVDLAGKVYVADTREQPRAGLLPNEDATVFTSVLTWDVDAWTTDLLDNASFPGIERQQASVYHRPGLKW